VEFLRNYKFSIAFENNDLPGYTTEKMSDAFHASTVPIYWGDRLIHQHYNPKAFIHRRDFESDEACIDHVLKVDADDELYLKYLSEPPFVGNKPNKYCDIDRLLDFFDGIFMTQPAPVAQRRWFWKLTRWRLAKRGKNDREYGGVSAEDRYQERVRERARQSAATRDPSR
jgi:hypothetical protein